MLGRRTLVKLDARGYSDIAEWLESLTDAISVSKLNAKIRQWAEDALNEIGPDKGEILEKGAAGDSVLVSFRVADDAHCFSKLVHYNLERWNLIESINPKIQFRIGCSTGELDVTTHDGCLNTIAYRIEPHASPGGTLIHSSTYSELSSKFQDEYDIEEIVPGKRKEKFRVRRWLNHSRQGSRIINRILDIPQISSSKICSCEVVSLDTKGEEIYRDFQDFHYLIESIEQQEIRLMIIPSGEYGMGSSERGCRRSEKPQHLVKISSFLMSQFPVTKAQWTSVAAGYPQVNRELKKIPSRKGARNSPVVKISWHDAVEFCDRLSAKAGHIYRPPTEAEWEYACRAGTYTTFHFGPTMTAHYANYDGTIKYYSEPITIYRRKTNAIGEFPYPNRFGLFDMHGNTWDWCLDDWCDNYDNAHSNGQVWHDELEQRRVMRGGSFRNESQCCTSTFRLANHSHDETGDNIGFRIVRSI